MILSIIVPVYNEKDTILEILKRIDAVNLDDLSFKKEIIITDDGSTDGTGDILNNLKDKYKIIHHSENQGKGAAIQTGLKHASGDFIIIQDADLEYDPGDYKKLLECAFKNNAEVVYGSRRLNPKNQYSHLAFYLGGLFITWLAKILYRLNITDESTGYKLFRAEILKSINLKSKGFGFCPEVTAKIAKRGIKIYETPINYFPRNQKEGKKIKWKDGIEAAWILIKYRLID